MRSQMDVRICFRVRERKDVDLILGQGMLTAGWNAHTLNAPGKFLIAAAEHDTPRRARAYLLTDEAVTGTASRYAHSRPPLDEVSQQAISEHWHAEPPDTPGQDTPQENDETDNGSPGRLKPCCAPPCVRAGPRGFGSQPHAPDGHGPPLGLLPAYGIGRSRARHPGHPGTVARHPGR